ncbi:MAG TPA: hypothetical protein VK568_10695 [Thermodesulfobacteriota bacterium]|nr:hypothetical protein [Thermodesulfobacteriota bacterium]
MRNAPAFAEAPARRTGLWQAGLRAGRDFGLRNLKLKTAKTIRHSLNIPPVLKLLRVGLPAVQVNLRRAGKAYSIS